MSPEPSTRSERCRARSERSFRANAAARWWLLWIAALLLSLLLVSARASAQTEPAQVLVCHGPEDLALLERIRGQTNDLELELVPVEVVMPPGRDLPLPALSALARQHDARFVVWFFRPAPGQNRLLVHIADLQDGRISTRKLGEQGDPDAESGGLSSSTLEAAALVVRSGLRALASGEPIGEPIEVEPEPSPPEPAPARTATPQAKPAEATEPSVPPYAQTRTAWYAGLRWRVTQDGTSRVGHHGPGLYLRLLRQHFDGSVWVDAGIPMRHEDAYGTLTLSRHTLGVAGAWRTLLGPTFDLSAGIRAGLAAYHRVTVATEPGVLRTPAHMQISWLVGPALGAAWQPRAGRFRLGLEGGLDVVPLAPHIDYEVDGRSEKVLRPWRVQPNLGVGLEIRLGP